MFNLLDVMERIFYITNLQIYWYKNVGTQLRFRVYLRFRVILRGVL